MSSESELSECLCVSVSVCRKNVVSFAVGSVSKLDAGRNRTLAKKIKSNRRREMFWGAPATTIPVDWKHEQ